MMTRSDSGKKGRNVKLINEIDALNKGLYPEKRTSSASASSSSYYGAIGRGKSTAKIDRPDSLPKPKNRVIGDAESSGKDTKPSFWEKTKKLITKPRSRRFNLCFTVQVHKIKDLPPAFNGRSLVVHWKWGDGGLVTSPSKVSQSIAEFEEQLSHTSIVHGTTGSGPRHSAKYEPKRFSLYASQEGKPEIDLGRHHEVDLTKLLPLTFEELEGEKSSGKWSTTYRLLGKAAGATLSVSFAYTLFGDNPFMPPNSKNVLELLNSKQISPAPESLPQPPYDRVLHEVLPAADTDLSDSLKKLEFLMKQEDKAIAVSVDRSEPGQSSISQTDDLKQDFVCGNDDLSSDDKHVESSVEKKAATDDPELENLKGQPISYLENSPDNNIQEFVVYDDNTKESILKEIESAVDLENEALDTAEEESELGVPDQNVEGKPSEVEVSVYLDDIESAENEFLNLFGVDDSPNEDEPESPRERLLREFEREAEISGYSLFGCSFSEEEEEEEEEISAYDAPRVQEWGSLSGSFDIPPTVELGEDHYFDNCADDFDLASVYQMIEHQKFETEGSGWRPRAKVLEDLETEELMRVRGLTEKTFESSPSDHNTFSQSPSEPTGPTHQDPLTLPDLGEGLGPFVQTKNGGFLRSMNPELFTNSKSGGRLIMQVSSPVVVPADMGSEVMDVLENLASIGLERLSAQANKLMPLEEISGKSMQQFAWEAAAPRLETNDRQDSLQRESDSASASRKKSKKRSSRPKPRATSSSEYVNIEDLAPLAMDKIEAVSMEGLKIQSGMSEEEAPSNIIPKSLGVDGAVGLQLLDIKHDTAAVDGLMGLSLTLDEWMRMDSGEIDGDEERTKKILAAHHASKGGPTGKRGLFGNSFTVALMVQLRDPLRDYEPVGTPMLALIQVERVFVPPKPKVYGSVSEAKKDDDDDDEGIKVSEEELIPKYKVEEVHVAGLKSQVGKTKLWGSASQQQSGSRWLLANGMGKANKKQPFLKTKAKSSLPGSSKQATAIAQSGDTLWSISTKVHGSGSKWKELVSLNPHFRNPNLVIPMGTVVRLR